LLLGGAYGFARVSLGIYMGYMVGCLETLQYVMYVAASVLTIGQIITQCTGLSRNLEPAWWAVFFATSLGVQLPGGKLFWRFNLLLAVVITAIPILYVICAIPSADLPAYGKWSEQEPYYFIGGMKHFLASLPVASWLYVGVEALPLSSATTKDVSTCKPVFCLLMTGCIWLCVCGLMILITLYALEPPPNNSPRRMCLTG